MSGAMSLVALLVQLLLLLTAQFGELFASGNSMEYDEKSLSSRRTSLFKNIIVYNVVPIDRQVDAGHRRKGSRRTEEAKGPVEEYFDQFAESVIFVNIMKTNLEATIKEMEGSERKLSFTIPLQQLREMKYRLVDTLTTFQSYKLEFSRLYDKVFDFYLMGTATDALTEDHFENITSYGMYSDIFYHVLRFKVLRDLYSVTARETTEATWPADLGDIPPDGVVGELSSNVMSSLGNVLGASKFVEMIFGSQLPLQNGPDWDNAYPGNVYNLMTSTKYYVKSLISYKMVTSSNKIKQAKVYLSANVIKILSTMAKQRLLNALMHKTLLRLFSRMKDLETFMKTGKNTHAVTNKRYFESVLENTISSNGGGIRPDEPHMEIDHTSSPSNGNVSTEVDNHVSKRFSEDQEWPLLLRMYQMLKAPYGGATFRKKTMPPKGGKVISGKVEGGSSEMTILYKTPYGLRVISKEDARHGHYLVQIHKVVKQTSLIVAHQISTYLGKIVTTHFIKETFGYLGSGVNDWVRFINSGNMSGGNALVGKIEKYNTILTTQRSITAILKSFGLVGKFDIDETDVHAMVKASMPFSFEDILEHLKTLNKNTSRTFVRFKNLIPIMEVVKIRMLMQKMNISNYVASACGGRAKDGDNLYLTFQKYRGRDSRLKQTLSKFFYNNILRLFVDGNLWLEGFYSSRAVSAVTPDYHLVLGKVLRKANVGGNQDSGMYDTLLELKIIDSFLSKCYFSFVNVICDRVPDLYTERVTEIFLDLITGFVKAEILPEICKPYDYKEKNSQKLLR